MFSLIVTTQGDRLIEFERFMKSLLSQHDFELILVDQSQDSVVKSVFDRYKYRGVYIRTDEKISLSRARNIGIKHASGEYYAFPDDDCWYPEGLLTRVRQLFDSYNAFCICLNAYDPIQGRSLMSRKSAKSIVKITKWNALKYPVSIGIFTRKNPFLFDETFGVGAKWGAGEESDYIRKIICENEKILYFRDEKVYHPYIKELDNSAMAQKAYCYGRGYGALVKKHINEKDYTILLDYLITLTRSFGGIAYYTLRKSEKQNMYCMRIKGMIDGFKDY